MGLTTSALQIGRSALMAYQSALQVIGNNISNVGSPNYTRQSPILTPIGGPTLPEGFRPGGGVALTGLQRHINEALEGRLRTAIGDQNATLGEQQSLDQIESLLNELTDNDLSTLLTDFFNTFSSVQNNPTDLATRGMVTNTGTALAAALKRQRNDLLIMHDTINKEITQITGRVDQILSALAPLNTEIVSAESTGQGGANALRDQRDALLRELSELVNVDTREQESGAINVYIGSDLVVQAGVFRGVKTTIDTSSGVERAIVRFSDDNSEVQVTGGRLEGLIAGRDTHVTGQIANLDTIATTLIQEVNKLHSEGQGLIGHTDVTGTYDVLDSTAALNSTAAGLDLTPRNGTFLITVKDQNAGTSVTITVHVDLDGVGTDTTLDSLAADITANVANVTATVTPDKHLRLQTSGGNFEMFFSEDSSNALSALGINTFFDGKDAADIAVEASVAADPNRVAASLSGLPGDASNAAKIAKLADDSVSSLSNQSIIEYYNTAVTDVAVTTAAATSGLEAADIIVNTLTAQRESISGVSLDEEATDLMRLERSFQGAARYITVVDGLIAELLNLVR